MHRSGTSALARGLQMLGVYLGNDFLSPQPDNPTGYWEDRNIFEINERLLAVFGLKWEDVALIDDARWHEPSGGITAGRGRSIPQIASSSVIHCGVSRTRVLFGSYLSGVWHYAVLKLMNPTWS